MYFILITTIIIMTFIYTRHQITKRIFTSSEKFKTVKIGDNSYCYELGVKKQLCRWNKQSKPQNICAVSKRAEMLTSRIESALLTYLH